MLRSRAVTAGLALALTLVAAPAIAHAVATGGSPAPESLYAQAKAQAAAAARPEPGLIEALTRDLGLTGDQAAARLINEAAAAKVEPVLRARLGDDFAGLWLTGPTAELVVATSDSTKVSAILKTGAQAKLVTHSLATLEAAKAGLDRRAGEVSEAASLWYVDVQANSVVVLAHDPARAREAVAGSGLAGLADLAASPIRVQQSDERPRALYDVRGGDAYYMGSGGRCSVGFSVTKAGSQGGFVTAGHCGTVGTATRGSNQVAQGTFRGSSFPGNDYAWVEVNSQWTPTGVVNAYNSGILPVRGSTQRAVGSSICRSGSTTQYHCGTISQHNTSVTYSQGTVTGVTRTTVCAEPGDSGGSYISGDQAQGVTSGGSGNCSSGGTTYHQPVNEILSAYGLTLAVAGGGPGEPTPTPTVTQPGGTWAPNTAYAAGSQVTYGGATYRCLQGHTSQSGWEPPNVPALWQRL
ncbi:alpha-lytic protease prodomain-containing protein [Planomonospora sp. ID67723]|uniref:carbohydrate-binding protein n=1 Tax=Planomonospora sp. ID67723 TaxID=2738134 RepID=UPI0018C41236|nr:carbohydrate-binding protein [Planomonospora sp. ID67723]MBG0829183.1 alpha-lytic protease prodomain-containing protein [Planomonospora sp. ID67723]